MKRGRKFNEKGIVNNFSVLSYCFLRGGGGVRILLLQKFLKCLNKPIKNQKKL
jgi:hypothetical protein